MARDFADILVPLLESLGELSPEQEKRLTIALDAAMCFGVLELFDGNRAFHDHAAVATAYTAKKTLLKATWEPEFLSKLTKKLAEKHQIIAATHSPFALATPGATTPGATIVDLRDGYAAACRGATAALADALKNGRLPSAPPPAPEAPPAPPKLKTQKRIR